ncbi:hypothetical protein AJ88_16580 [Mesorhizobium amorphae CCBAU 01583]|nr:hypothetical protein AJ88_16580 [Mesorhizobium amorphae CCBAU 01583]
MRHLLAKTAEMRRDEEVGMDAGRGTNGAGVQKAPDAPDIGDIAAVLHDGMNTPSAAGGLDDGARILRAVGQRLLGQEMAIMRKCGKRDLAPGGGNHNVEHRVGPCLVEHRVEAGSDDGAGELVFARPRLRSLGVEIDEADNGEPVDLPLASSQCLLIAPQPTRTTFIIQRSSSRSVPPDRSHGTHGITVNVFP